MHRALKHIFFPISFGGVFVVQCKRIAVRKSHSINVGSIKSTLVSASMYSLKSKKYHQLSSRGELSSISLAPDPLMTIDLLG